jgi:hypothetical protein
LATRRAASGEARDGNVVGTARGRRAPRHPRPDRPAVAGGTGERLNLAWWVAVALRKSDGTPAAIWGLGGRAGGRPVPREEVIRILTDAAHHDLAQPAERAVLRGRLAIAR